MSANYLLFTVGKYGLHQALRQQFGGLSFSLFGTLISLGLIPVFLLPQLSIEITQTILNISGSILTDSSFSNPTSLKKWFDPPYLLTVLGVLSGYLLGRYSGKASSDPTRLMNCARRKYENCVEQYGYWYEKQWPPEAQAQISVIQKTYVEVQRMMEIQEDKDVSRPGGIWYDDSIKWQQRWMVFFYQKALFLSSTKNYKSSLERLNSALLHLNLYAGSEEATEEELLVIKSQILFLMAENHIMLANNPEAEKRLLECLEIDKSLSDSDGIKTINSRLVDLR